MKSLLLALSSGLLSCSVCASEYWTFSEPVAITAKPVAGVFLHLEGSNRQHIAVNDGSVAVVWEDDRTGDPQIYLSIKSSQQNRFSEARMVSTGSEAYEPAISTINGMGFVIVWEQDGSVYARMVIENQLSAALKLSAASASHASVVSLGGKIFATWREQHGRDWSIKLATIEPDQQMLVVNSVTKVEPKPLSSAVLYPALAVNPAGLCIAWEDRRAGHTRLMFSYSTDQAKTFSEPQFLNEFYSNRNEYDKGNGVTRVSLSAFGEDEIIAAWMDKRRGENGYGIYGALGSDGGALFGPNERIHSAFGDELPHYNPATAGNANGLFVVVWDDFRKGDSDIWLSAYNDYSEWSEDYSPPSASGAGEQSHPAVSMDEQDRLHLVWMERSDLNAPGQLWYSIGQVASSN